MDKPERFKIPAKRLQKLCIIRGKNLLDVTTDFIEILNRGKEVKRVRDVCEIPYSVYMENADSIKRVNQAKDILQNVLTQDKIRQKILKEAFQDLEVKKKELATNIEELEEKCVENVKRRERAKYECLSKIGDYLDQTMEIKREREKQDILIRIGFIMESILEDLSPYEETLGRLALQENAFKSKADTLHIKKNILLERRDSLTAKLQSDLDQTEDIKKKLFKRSFELRDSTHFAINLINRLQEIDIKSLRAVLELEAKTSTLRRRAYTVRAETAWFYWFLDWVLFDIIGQESLTGIDRNSSAQEKTQCLIEYYKNLKGQLSRLPKSTATRPVDMFQ